MIGIQTHLRGQIEGHRQTALTLTEQIAVTLVGFGGRAEAGALAHGPQAAAVHGGIYAPGIGKFARVAEVLLRMPATKIIASVHSVEGLAGQSSEPRSTLFFRSFGCFCHEI